MYRRTRKIVFVLPGTSYNKESLRKLVWSKTPHTLREFCGMTSLHGVKYLAETNRCLLERIFWVLALTSGYLGSALFVSQIVADWRSSPVLMTVETQVTPSSNYPSPAVTICTSSHISNRKVDFSKLIRSANSSPEVFARVNVIHDLCGDGLVNSEYLDSEALKYIVQNYLPRSEDVILSIKRMEHEEKPMKVQVTITPVSICSTHNMIPLDLVLREEFLAVYRYLGLFKETKSSMDLQPWTPDTGYESEDHNVPMRLWGDGYMSSIKYLLAARDVDHDPLCSFGIKGLSIYLHSPVEMPWRIHSSVFTLKDQQIVSLITPSVVSTEQPLKVWSPMKRGCFFDRERYLRFFHVYTQKNCQRECDANATLKHCGCVLFSHPRNLTMKICGNRSSYCFFDDKKGDECHCLPACNELEFEVENDIRPWRFNSNSTFSNIPRQVEINSTLIALLAIAAKKRYLNIIKRSALYGPAGFVANIGGVVSLFLGFSFMSVIEMVYFMTLRMFTNVWNARRVESQQQQHFSASSKTYPFVN